MRDNTGKQLRFADDNERLDFFSCNILIHENLVRSICCSILESPDDAEDALQDTMLNAWGKLDSLRSMEAAKAWLCTIAKNCALDMKERIKRNGDLLPAYECRKELDNLEAGVPGPEEQLILRSQFEVVRTAFMKLPGKYRCLLYMRFFLCMDGSEIECIMGMKSRDRINACYKAKVALRTNLAELEL